MVEEAVDYRGLHRIFLFNARFVNEGGQTLSHRYHVTGPLSGMEERLMLHTCMWGKIGLRVLSLWRGLLQS